MKYLHNDVCGYSFVQTCVPRVARLHKVVYLLVVADVARLVRVSVVIVETRGVLFRN
jgi:hypothetical protein